MGSTSMRRDLAGLRHVESVSGSNARHKRSANEFCKKNSMTLRKHFATRMLVAIDAPGVLRHRAEYRRARHRAECYGGAERRWRARGSNPQFSGPAID